MSTEKNEWWKIWWYVGYFTVSKYLPMEYLLITKINKEFYGGQVW